jgi:hypothetical protein
VTVIDPNGYCCDGPDARCKPATISLNASGQGVIQVANVNNGSTYECGLLSISINQTAVSCSNVGTPLVITLTVTDINNATDNCTAIVTVVDNQLPAITCPAAKLVTCASAIPPVNLNAGNASDNCRPVTKSHLNDSAPYAQTCDNRFKINRIYKATDGPANTKTCVQVDYGIGLYKTCFFKRTRQCNRSVQQYSGPGAPHGFRRMRRHGERSITTVKPAPTAAAPIPTRLPGNGRPPTPAAIPKPPRKRSPCRIRKSRYLPPCRKT